jgi:hypothetical protein
MYIITIGFMRIALKNGKGVQAILDTLSRGAFVECEYLGHVPHYFRSDITGEGITVEVVPDDQVHLREPAPRRRRGEEEGGFSVALPTPQRRLLPRPGA